MLVQMPVSPEQTLEELKLWNISAVPWMAPRLFAIHQIQRVCVIEPRVL